VLKDHEKVLNEWKVIKKFLINGTKRQKYMIDKTNCTKNLGICGG
jgi:hypothetical protein